MTDFEKEQKEILKIQKDILTARSIITDGISRYKKKKLNARSKKQAEDMQVMFADLEPYNFDFRELQESYGYGFITEKEFNRLYDLLDLHKEYINKNGRFQDRVTDMLEYALDCVADMYRERIYKYNQMVAENKKREDEKLRAEIKFEHEKYMRGLS